VANAGVEKKIADANATRDPERHGWRRAQGLMHAAEIIERDVQRDGRWLSLFLENALVSRVKHAPWYGSGRQVQRRHHRWQFL